MPGGEELTIVEENVFPEGQRNRPSGNVGG